MMRIRFSGAIFVFVLSLVWPGAARADDPPAKASDNYAFKEMLFLSTGGGAGGRNSIPTDPLLERRIAGAWQTPKAGESITLSAGNTRKWELGKPNADGVFALRGGFGYAEITAPKEEVMILEASGHGLVFVNGEPHSGDVYNFGIVKIPVLLHAGKNAFLFRAGRGQLKAHLTRPTAPVIFNTADVTFPDVTGEAGKEYWAAAIVMNATTEPQKNLTLDAKVGKAQIQTVVPFLAPLTVYKAPFRIKIAEPITTPNGQLELSVHENTGGDSSNAKVGKLLSKVMFSLPVRKPEQTHKETFKSSIDDSVQYFAVTPALPNPKIAPPGLILTLHGAGVEAAGQAPCYSRKPGFYVVAPPIAGRMASIGKIGAASMPWKCSIMRKRNLPPTRGAPS